MGARLWGCSSVGRAPALQAGGQGFESPHLHGDNEESIQGSNDLARRWDACVPRGVQGNTKEDIRRISVTKRNAKRFVSPLDRTTVITFVP